MGGPGGPVGPPAKRLNCVVHLLYKCALWSQCPSYRVLWWPGLPREGRGTIPDGACRTCPNGMRIIRNGNPPTPSALGVLEQTRRCRQVPRSCGLQRFVKVALILHFIPVLRNWTPVLRIRSFGFQRFSFGFQRFAKVALTFQGIPVLRSRTARQTLHSPADPYANN